MDQTTEEHKNEGAVADRTSQLIRSVIGYAISVVCLVWVFHDIRGGDVLRYVSQINWWWIGLAIVADVLSYVCQAWRWQLLLKPVGEISITRAAQAIYAGLFANALLPMRIGEVFRTYLVSKWLPARVSSVIPSILMERLLDGILLLIGVALVITFVPLPKDLREAGDIFALLVFFAVAAFIFLVLPTAKSAGGTETVEQTVRSKTKAFLISIADGLRAIRAWRTLSLSFIISLLFLLLQILSFWLVMLGYDLNVSAWMAGTVFLVVHLGTAIPNAPANIGTYQFFTVVGLALFGVDKTLATGFSVVVFILLTLPLLLIGFIAIARSGFTLLSLREEVRLQVH